MANHQGPQKELPPQCCSRKSHRSFSNTIQGYYPCFSVNEEEYFLEIFGRTRFVFIKRTLTFAFDGLMIQTVWNTSRQDPVKMGPNWQRGWGEAVGHFLWVRPGDELKVRRVVWSFTVIWDAAWHRCNTMPNVNILQSGKRRFVH